MKKLIFVEILVVAILTGVFFLLSTFLTFQMAVLIGISAIITEQAMHHVK